MEKLKSRKFWICVAAMLASIAVSIAGLAQTNEIITAIGTVSGIISAAIYAFCEAWVDGKAVEATNYVVVDDTDPVDIETDGE